MVNKLIVLEKRSSINDLGEPGGVSPRILFQ